MSEKREILATRVHRLLIDVEEHLTAALPQIQAALPETELLLAEVREMLSRLDGNK